MDCSLPGSCVHGILQAGIFHWVAMPSFRGSFWPGIEPVSPAVPTVQFSSVAQSCLTLCDPMNRSTPGLPVHHHLPEFTQTHIHRVRDAIQPSHPGSSPSPPAPNLSQHQSLFQWVNAYSAGEFFTAEPPGKPLNLIFFSVWMTRKSHWFQRKYHFPLKGHMPWHSASHRTINRTDQSWLTL